MTLDLLLGLGDKLADIVTLLLKNRASKSDQQQAQDWLKQFGELKTAHQEIKAVLQAYNLAVSRLQTSREPQELFSLCTPEEYRRVQQLMTSLQTAGCVSQQLDRCDVLSVRLTRRHTEEIDFDQKTQRSLQEAEVYTFEKWRSAYQSGQYTEEDVVNKYRLIMADNHWRINQCEVFQHAARS